eukprot:jgi/Galph1/6070/GphlegSOOS_G4640.1
MTELENWEDLKENIQPIKSGREPEKLKEFGYSRNNESSKHYKEEEERLEKEHEIWEACLEKAMANPTGHDIAKLWRHYWKWIQQSYPKGYPNSLEFLEKATESIVSVGGYQDSIHALKLWISYADSVSDPLSIFEYMYANDIGKKFSLFYEAYALILEKNRRFPDADKLYLEGIHLHAEPLDRLEKRHQEFQHRMVKRLQRQDADRLQDNSVTKTYSTNVDHTIREPLQTLQKERTSNKNINTLKNSSTNNSNFEIYDDRGQGCQGKSPGSYPNLPRMTKMTKENEGNIDIWKGNHLPQSNTHSSYSSTCTGLQFDIFEDVPSESPENTKKSDKEADSQQRIPLRPCERKKTREGATSSATFPLETQTYEKENSPRLVCRRELDCKNSESVFIKKDNQVQPCIQTSFKDNGGISNEPSFAENEADPNNTEVLFPFEIGKDEDNDIPNETIMTASPTIFTKMAIADIEAMFDSTLMFEKHEKLRKEEEELEPSEECPTFEVPATNNNRTGSHDASFTIYEDPI